jgi:hypothetical protein
MASTMHSTRLPALGERHQREVEVVRVLEEQLWMIRAQFPDAHRR